MNKPNTTILLVYGTLQKSFSNNRLICDQQFLGKAKTKEKYVLMDFGGFPGMFQEEGPTQVHGELWAIDEHARNRCDCLESHPDWYCRTPIVVLMGGEEIACETYFNVGRKHGVPCPDGIWPRTR